MTLRYCCGNERRWRRCNEPRAYAARAAPGRVRDTMIGVCLSSGVPSWAAARLLKDSGEHFIAAFADTLIEDEDNYRFLDDCVENLGCELTRLVDGRTPWQVFRCHRYIGNSRVAPCSIELKRELLDRWAEERGTTAAVVGFTIGEEERRDRLTKKLAPREVRCPLIDAGMTADDCLDLADKHGLRIPRLYDLGFKHANCGGFCVRAGHEQFVLLAKHFPCRFAEHEREEDSLREVLGKDVSILRDRRGGMVRSLPLSEFRRRMDANEPLYAVGGNGCSCLSE